MNTAAKILWVGIALMIVMGQILGAFMYNEQAKYVEAAYSGLTERAALFAKIDLASNVLALLMQTVVVGWLRAILSISVAYSSCR